jgi:hypothetical protein
MTPLRAFRVVDGLSKWEEGEKISPKECRSVNNRHAGAEIVQNVVMTPRGEFPPNWLEFPSFRPASPSSKRWHGRCLS